MSLNSKASSAKTPRVPKDRATPLSYAPLCEAGVGEKGRLKSGRPKFSLSVGSKGPKEICLVKQANTLILVCRMVAIDSCLFITKENILLA